jgi:predicted transcriptional regulator
VAAASVRVRASLGEGLAWVGGDAPHSAVGGEIAWERQAVGPGSGEIVLVAEAGSVGSLEVAVRLDYTSPDGSEVGSASAVASVVVLAPTPITSLAVSTGLLAAAALSAGAIATERGKVAFLFLAIPLYTRLRHERVLDHETRGMIRGYIVANPGDHYNSIKEALELPNGTLAYHIQVLQKESLVRSVKDGKFRRFYPFEMKVPQGGQPTKIQKVILDVIRTNPGVTQRDLAGLLRITSSTVSYHLEKLGELGRIEFRREGITKRLYVRAGEGT